MKTPSNRVSSYIGEVWDIKSEECGGEKKQPGLNEFCIYIYIQNSMLGSIKEINLDVDFTFTVVIKVSNVNKKMSF